MPSIMIALSDGEFDRIVAALKLSYVHTHVDSGEVGRNGQPIMVRVVDTLTDTELAQMHVKDNLRALVLRQDQSEALAELEVQEHGFLREL